MGLETVACDNAVLNAAFADRNTVVSSVEVLFRNCIEIASWIAGDDVA